MLDNPVIRFLFRVSVCLEHSGAHSNHLTKHRYSTQIHFINTPQLAIDLFDLLPIILAHERNISRVSITLFMKGEICLHQFQLCASAFQHGRFTYH